MKQEAKRLGENLRRIRAEKDMSQVDVARSLGVSRGFVSNIENGNSNPTLATIVRLANAVGVASDRLLK